MIQFILGLFAIFLYPILEGKREYYFYLINQAAGFKLRGVDSDRKTVNVSIFLLSVCSFSYFITSGSLELIALICMATFWRWIILDGILNNYRTLGFWYAGNSGRSFTDKILFPLPIWLRALVKCLPFFTFSTLFICLRFF